MRALLLPALQLRDLFIVVDELPLRERRRIRPYLVSGLRPLLRPGAASLGLPGFIFIQTLQLVLAQLHVTVR